MYRVKKIIREYFIVQWIFYLVTIFLFFLNSFEWIREPAVREARM